MDVKELTFTKDWTNPEDFPVVVNDAVQARKNIQLLHDEVKQYLNETIVPSLRTSGTTAENAKKAAEAADKKAAAVITVSAVEPENKTGLWVDTGNKGLIKYYDTANKVWKPCAATPK